MKIEYKEVTVQRPVFIAADGQEFMDKDACEEYEFNILEESLELYDENCNKVDSVDKCYIANLVTADDVNNFIAASDLYGCVSDGITTPGVYIYGSNDVWINIEELLSRIKGGAKDD